MKRKYIWGGLGVFALLTVLVIYFFPHFFLSRISQALVVEDPLRRVSAIVVLAGSSSGNRVQTASQLFQQGYADYMVFSGFEVYPGMHTHTMMKNYAIQLGVPDQKILTLPAEGEVSTFGEAIANLKILEKNGLNDFILVTSGYHTRRARFVYRKLIAEHDYDMDFIVHPASDPNIPINGWWKTRTGQKGIFYEITKNIYYRFAY